MKSILEQGDVEGEGEEGEGGQDTPLSSPPGSPAPASALAGPGGEEGVSVAGGSASQWPSMQDLNTRLRRLITSYQRNYKREELKMQQRARVIIFISVACEYYNLHISKTRFDLI